MPYILALDQGTTSSRALLFDHAGNVTAVAQREFTQHFPKPGWVEHDPNEIWSTQAGMAAEVVTRAGISGEDVAAIGITNQRETTIVWDRRTGAPVYNAIVWQDRRTAGFCDQLREAGHEDTLREKTGLVLDAYFSATKIRWILDNVDGARDSANAGHLAFGTVDSWLVWKMTDGGRHITDATNASRTLLCNLRTGEWDDDLLDLFDIPRPMLPEICASSEVYGETAGTVLAHRIPIAGIGGDQHAALFGQVCTEPGMVKNTYGTGCFMLMNTGDTPVISQNNLLSTIAWKMNGQLEYALEGSIFVAGAVVQWLRDGLGIIRTSAEVEDLAAQVPDNGGVYLVPAFTGLGAPHWDPYARGTMVGLTRGSSAGHIARAALESIAYQTADVLRAMSSDSGLELAELRVDGGATANDLLMQFQADILNVSVVRPKVTETTALGAAYLAGLAVGFWQDLDEISSQWQVDRRFEPSMSEDERSSLTADWTRALDRAKGWVTSESA